MQKRLLLVAILIVGNTQLWAKDVKGKIEVDGKQLANVVVTDGMHFTKTNVDGIFSFEIEDTAEFVYIFTPSGYTAPFQTGVPQFYKRLSEEVGNLEFKLKKLPYTTKNYALLAIADPQTKTPKHFEQFEKELITNLKKSVLKYFAKKNNVVGVALGGIVHDNLPLLNNYKTAIASLNIPFYTVIGKHDYNEEVTKDYANTIDYRKHFGPTDYGFNVGNQYYIVLNNIIYNGRKNCITDLTDAQLAWVKNYLHFVPKGSDLVFIMYAPFTNYSKNVIVAHGEVLLNICEDYNVKFMSEHTHLNCNTNIAESVVEYNINAVCNTFPVPETCKNRTPDGYKIFETTEDNFKSYYKSIGKDRYYPIEIFDRGMVPKQANAVVAKVWNWNPNWKVVWYADGVYMGNMKQIATPFFMQFRQSTERASKGVKTDFYFAANPSLSTKVVKVMANDKFGNCYKQEIELSSIEVEGHRGGAGLMPENTIDAMLEAIKLGVNTLELDVHISKDGEVIVAHDTHINPKFTINAKRKEITEKKAKKLLFSKMRYSKIRKFDTGSKTYDRFPEQKKKTTYIPLLSALIDSVENFVTSNKFSPVHYNIEIKSSQAKEEKGLVYNYKEFADKAIAVLQEKNLGERLQVQSFDSRCLNYINKKYMGIRLAFLVGNKEKFESNMAKLNFVPKAYSPNYKMVNLKLIKFCKEKGIKIVPWTVDTDAEITKMIKLGVDGIISNYPNRVLKLLREYNVDKRSE